MILSREATIQQPAFQGVVKAYKFQLRGQYYEGRGAVEATKYPSGIRRWAEDGWTDKEIGKTNRNSAEKAKREEKRRYDSCHYKLQQRRLKPGNGSPWMQKG